VTITSIAAADRAGKSRGTDLAVWLSIIVLALPAFLLAIPADRVFPSSDEWTYVDPATPSLQWLFAQHVDHRIPIQKALQLTVLRLAHFDFRWLVGVNCVLAMLTSAMFIGAARLYRRSAILWDILIPLCMLNLGTGFSNWGFEFQFLSSIMFSAAFLLSVAVYERNERPAYLTGAFTALFLCSWSGLNGVIISTCVSIAMAALILAGLVRFGVLPKVALAITVVTNVALWLTWTPSAASAGQMNPADLLWFIYGLIKSPLVVYAFVDTGWKFSIMAALVVAGCAGALLRLRNLRELKLSDFAVLAMLGAGGFLIASIAYGRSKLSAWAPGLEMHYGTLAILLIVVAWIALSANADRRMVTAFGFILFALFAKAYYVNYEWRAEYVAASRAEYAATRLELAGTDSPEDITSQHILRYFFADTPGTREQVIRGIPVLRKYERY